MGIKDWMKTKVNEVKEDLAKQKELKEIEKNAMYEAKKKEAVKLGEEKAKIERKEKVKNFKKSFSTNSSNGFDFGKKSQDMQNYLLGK